MGQVSEKADCFMLYGRVQQHRGLAWTNNTPGKLDVMRRKMDEMHEKLTEVMKREGELKRACKMQRIGLACALLVICLLFNYLTHCKVLL